MARTIPLRFQADCEFCGDEVDIRKPGVYQYQSGWVMKRREGGGNAVSLPNREHRYACHLCIERESHGLASYQPHLFA